MTQYIPSESVQSTTCYMLKHLPPLKQITFKLLDELIELIKGDPHCRYVECMNLKTGRIRTYDLEDPEHVQRLQKVQRVNRRVEKQFLEMRERKGMTVLQYLQERAQGERDGQGEEVPKST